MPSFRSYGLIARLLFGAIMALFFLWLAATNAREVVSANNAKTWPTAQGVVIASGIVTCNRSRGSRPSVQYQYSVDPQQYDGWRIAFGGSGCDVKSSALAMAERYPKGATVTVHFKPSDPSESTLLVGEVMTGTWVQIIGPASVFVLVSFTAIVVALESRPE